MDNDGIFNNQRLSISLERQISSRYKHPEIQRTKLLTTEEVHELTQIAVKLASNNVSFLESMLVKPGAIPDEFKEQALRLHDRLNEAIGYVIVDCDPAGDRAPMIVSVEDRHIGELKKLLTGGGTFEGYIKKLRQYHWAPRCNVVWRQNTVAYRCQTCGLNSCMSLCAECFENADHEGHDYSRFFSTVGGCCDCGNVDVISPNGFCKFHREGVPRNSNQAPQEDVAMLRYVIVKLLTRLLVCLRRWTSFKNTFVAYSRKEGTGISFSTTSTNEALNKGILPIVNFLHELSEAGSVVTDIIIEYLLDVNFYADLCSGCITQALSDPRLSFENPDWRLHPQIQEDIASLKNLRRIVALGANLDCHPIEVNSVLDELVVYLIRMAYPQELIDLLLNLLYDTRYKEAFAKKFFSYYPYTTAMVAELLSEISLGSSEGSKIAERIVHISVQICSGANICTWLQNNINIINCVFQSAIMMSLMGARGTQVNHAEERFYAATPAENSETTESSGGWLNVSVDENPFFSKNADLFVLTDTQNLLVHQSIAKIFFTDEKLVEKYIRNVEFYHGMGVEWRIVSGDHRVNDWTSNAQKCYNVEFEACSLPMHNLIQHIHGPEDCELFYSTLINALNRWFNCINLENAPVETNTPPYAATFHIPLHRHVANLLFYMQSIGEPCKRFIDHLRSNEHFLRKLMLHPIRVHVIRAEYYAGMWTRNGQGMRTAVSHYCKPTITFSFQSADLILMRFAASNVNQEFFWHCIIKSFHLDACLNYPDDVEELDPDDVDTLVTRKGWISYLMDGALRLILDLLIGRRDTELDSDDLLKEEMVALLARQSLPYSHVKAVIPTRGNISFDSQMGIFDKVIDQVANFVEPDQNNSIQHGRFELKEEMYEKKVCPVFCRLRSFGMVDYTEFTNKMENKDKDRCNPPLPSIVPPWLPFRMYDFDDLYKARFDTLKGTPMLLTQPTFFMLCYKILQKVSSTTYYHSTVFQEVVYLLTLSVQFLKSQLFDECSHLLFQTNEYPFSAFLGDCEYPSTIRNTENPRKMVRDMFLKAYSPGDESIFTLLVELFVKLVKNQKTDCTDTEALLELREYVGNDDIKERIYGAGVQYVGRLLNSLFSLDDEIGAEIRKFLHATQMEPEAPMEVDTPSPADVSAAEKRTKLRKKKEAYLKQMQKKGAALMIHHMESEGISQAEMDRIETKTNGTQKYECPICSETTDHSLANPIGVFVHTRPNNVVANSVDAKGAVTELMELAPEPKASSASSGFPRMESSPKPPRVVKTKRQWYVERDTNCAIVFPPRDPPTHMTGGAQSVKTLRFRTGIEVRTCGHFAHLQCFKSYLNSITSSAIIRVDFSMSCPMCRSPTNAMLPLKIEYGWEKARADFDIQQVDVNAHEIYNLYYLRSHNPRPRFDNNDEMKVLLNEYRESYEAFEDIAYRQLINGQLDQNYERNFIEGRFKGFDARMGFVQSNVERMVMCLTLDLPLPFFAKNSVIEHILTGAVTLSLNADQEISHVFWKRLLNAATGTLAFKAESDPFPPMLMCDYQSLFLRCVAVPLADERFVDSDRLGYSRLACRILLNLCFTRAIQNTITKCRNRHLVKEFVETASFGDETILERSLQKVLAVSRDLFVVAVTELDCVSRDSEKLDFTTVEQLVNYTVEQAELIASYFTKFVIVLVHSVFKMEFSDAEKMYFRDGVFDNLYKVVYPVDDGSEMQSVAVSSRFFLNALLKTKDLPNQLLIVDSLMNETFDWKYRSVLRLPKLYDKMFSAFFGQKCTTCGKEPKHQMLCLLCGALMCLHKCNKDNDSVDESETLIERHTLSCGAGCCCYLSVNSTMVIINYYRHAVLWGTVYLDSHGEEDRNLHRGKPLYLSENRMKQLLKSWYIQDLDRRAHLRWFTLDQLPAVLKQCHHTI